MDIKIDAPLTDGRSWSFTLQGTGGDWEWSHFDLVHG
jgi:hypothetical protein